MSSGALRLARARLLAALKRHRRPAWAMLLVLLVAALTLHARAFRREALQELSANLDLGLDVTEADVDSWTTSRRAHAEILARVVAAPSTAARPYDGLVAALMAGEGYEGAWIYDQRGELLAERANPSSAGAPPDLRSFDTAATAPRPRAAPSGSVYLDFAVPSMRDGVRRGTVVLRAAPDDGTFRNLNPSRSSNRTARTTLIARTGDSVRIVSTRSHAARTPPRVLALAAMPAHVRDALEGRRSRGEGQGMFGAHVAYAARPALTEGWALVREMETQEYEDMLRGPLLVQAIILGSLVILIVFVIVNRTRAASARRERELARLRTEFVASASHELRTPLAQIRLFSELLRSGGLRSEEDTDRALRVIEKESQRLSTLVDNLLNFAQLRRSVEEAPATTTDLADEARQVIADFEPLTVERQVTIIECLEPGLRARVDSRAFRQVLINFLDNAVKYGPAGQSVVVRVGTHGSLLQLAVEDEGRGIPADERAAIWQAFYRRDAAVASRKAGSGLGLAVVRDLVLQSGGAVHVEDSPGGGARFVAEFPRGDEAGV